LVGTVAQMNHLVFQSPDERARLLDTIAFEPDGRFQKNRVTLPEIHDLLTSHVQESIARHAGAALPTLILILGKCRVGSTPLANLFGLAGIPTIYQPLKTALRHALSGEQLPPWRLADDPVMVIKETAGPYVFPECCFNPLKVLLEAGYPAERLKVVFLERDPCLTFDSWLRHWSERCLPEALLTNFALASLNVQHVEGFAIDAQVERHHFAYDLSQIGPVVIPRLFERLGLLSHYDPAILANWMPGDSHVGSNTGITYSAQPENYTIQGVHAQQPYFGYIERQPHRLQPHQIHLIQASGLVTLHQRFLEQARSALLGTDRDIVPETPSLSLSA
jgi:hypothetical protein